MGMSRPYAFTTAAMAAALEDTPVTYEDLAEIERDFDDAETEISMFLAPFVCDTPRFRRPWAGNAMYFI